MNGSKIISNAVLITAILWGSIAASDRFYFAQAEEEISKSRDRLEALKRSNNENERLKENYQELERDLKAAESEYDFLKKLIPEEGELPRVFDWIAKRAIERNLKLEHFSQSGSLNQTAQRKEGIVEAPLQIEVLGYYDAVHRFLEDFSRFERVLKVRAVKMTQVEEQSSAYSTVRANINFSAFVANKNAEKEKN